jgi:hypothetical protein
MNNYYYDIQQPFEKALIGRNFAWFGSGVVQTGGGCRAFMIECGESSDPTVTVLITDEDTGELETTGPYTVGIYDQDNWLIGGYVTATNAQTAIDAVEKLVLEVTAS